MSTGHKGRKFVAASSFYPAGVNQYFGKKTMCEFQVYAAELK